MSLSGGLIPMANSDQSRVKGLAALQPLTGVQTVNRPTLDTSSNDFDAMFDEILDSPTKSSKSSKKSSKKSKKGNSKKSGKKSSFDYDDPLDDSFPSPTQTKSDFTLNPLKNDVAKSKSSDLLGESSEDFNINKNSNDGGNELEDSILGGLIGGGKSINRNLKKNQSLKSNNELDQTQHNNKVNSLSVNTNSSYDQNTTVPATGPGRLNRLRQGDDVNDGYDTNLSVVRPYSAPSSTAAIRNSENSVNINTAATAASSIQDSNITNSTETSATSFIDSGRQSRSRRQGGARSSRNEGLGGGGALGEIDELDRALGLIPLTSKIQDPFAHVNSSVTSLGPSQDQQQPSSTSPTPTTTSTRNDNTATMASLTIEESNATTAFPAPSAFQPRRSRLQTETSTNARTTSGFQPLNKENMDNNKIPAAATAAPVSSNVWDEPNQLSDSPLNTNFLSDDDDKLNLPTTTTSSYSFQKRENNKTNLDKFIEPAVKATNSLPLSLNPTTSSAATSTTKPVEENTRGLSLDIDSDDDLPVFGGYQPSLGGGGGSSASASAARSRRNVKPGRPSSAPSNAKPTKNQLDQSYTSPAVTSSSTKNDLATSSGMPMSVTTSSSTTVSGGHYVDTKSSYPSNDQLRPATAPADLELSKANEPVNIPFTNSTLNNMSSGNSNNINDIHKAKESIKGEQIGAMSSSQQSVKFSSPLVIPAALPYSARTDDAVHPPILSTVSTPILINRNTSHTTDSNPVYHGSSSPIKVTGATANVAVPVAVTSVTTPQATAYTRQYAPAQEYQSKLSGQEIMDTSSTTTPVYGHGYGPGQGQGYDLLLKEIESLKMQLTTERQTSEYKTNQLMVELQQSQGEVVSLKNQISILEADISRRRDEEIITTMRHKEELKATIEKATTDIEAINKRREMDVQFIENRHAEAIEALKKIHNDELAGVKQRFKDGVALEQLAGQIGNTTGAIRLIEEQLSSRHKGLELVKEGQLEARERLISEMESNARDRAELAEAEGYRLKGLLIHMEHMVSSLRSQGGEEKERLRQEHRRLESLQASLEDERNTLHKREAELNETSRRKTLVLQEESRKVAVERQNMLTEIENLRRTLESDKSDFSLHVTSSSRATESAMQRLRAEEDRLSRLREDVAAEREAFNAKKSMAMIDLKGAEEMRQQFALAKEEIVREKSALQALARDLQLASEQLSLRSSQLDAVSKELLERDHSLRQSWEQMQSVTTSLSRREHDTLSKEKQAERKLQEMQEKETQLVTRSVEIASKSRELMTLHRQHNYPIGTSIGWMGNDNAYRTESGYDRESTGNKLQVTVDVEDEEQVANEYPAYPPYLTSNNASSSYLGMGGGTGQKMSPILVNEDATRWRQPFSPTKHAVSPIELQYMRQRGDSGAPTSPLFPRQKPDIHDTVRKATTTTRPTSYVSFDRFTGENKELLDARKTLTATRGHLNRITNSKISTQRFLQEENSFVNNLMSRYR